MRLHDDNRVNYFAKTYYRAEPVGARGGSCVGRRHKFNIASVRQNYVTWSKLVRTCPHRCAPGSDARDNLKYMNYDAFDDAGPSEQVGTGADRFGAWLSIEEAVLLSSELGLPRTPKTIRKWASRSFGKPEDQAEIIIRQKDTPNGFRWMLDRVSLERKIQEEINLKNEAGEPVRTSPYLSEPVRTSETTENIDAESANRSEPVPGVVKPSEPIPLSLHEDIDGEFLKDQILAKDDQINKLNKMIERKDTQIDALLERDRETNILIQGLQSTLSNTLGIGPASRDQSRVVETQDVELEQGTNLFQSDGEQQSQVSGAGKTPEADNSDGV
jgi:hypothetical protein